MQMLLLSLTFAHGYLYCLLDQRALGMSMRVERASLQQVPFKIVLQYL